jgi:hypothetical protein
MEKNPYILLLQETKCETTEVDSILVRCWRHHNYANIDSRQSAGDLNILWNPETIILDNLFTTKWTISSQYKSIRFDKEGFITNVYESHILSEKISFLKNIEGLCEII